MLDSLTESEIDLFMDIYGEPQFAADWRLEGAKDE